MLKAIIADQQKERPSVMVADAGQDFDVERRAWRLRFNKPAPTDFQAQLGNVDGFLTFRVRLGFRTHQAALGATSGQSLEGLDRAATDLGT